MGDRMEYKKKKSSCERFQIVPQSLNQGTHSNHEQQNCSGILQHLLSHLSSHLCKIHNYFIKMTTVFPALTCSSLGDCVYCCYGSKPWCHKELFDLTDTSAGDYWKSAYLKKKQDFLEVYQTIIYAQIQPKAEKLTVKPHSSHHEAKQGGLRKPFAWQWNNNNKKKHSSPQISKTKNSFKTPTSISVEAGKYVLTSWASPCKGFSDKNEKYRR